MTSHIVRLLAAIALFLLGALLAMAHLIIYRDPGAALATLGGAILVAAMVAPDSHN